MDILAALKDEATTLQEQLRKLQGAIKALEGWQAPAKFRGVGNRVQAKRKMSAAARAKISKATKKRWAAYRAAKARSSK